MENMRQKIELSLQPVDCSLHRRGIVGEDLGRTQFTLGPSRGVLRASNVSQQQHEGDSESEDDLDAFSSKNRTSSSTPLPQKSKVLKNRKAPRKAKTVAVFGHLNDPPVSSASIDVDFDGENNSPQKVRTPTPRPAFKVAKSFDFNKVMLPSTQLAPKMKQPRKISSQNDGKCASPLSQNRTKTPKVSRVEAHKSGPTPFPLEINISSTSKMALTMPSPRKPAPFPVDVLLELKPTSSPLHLMSPQHLLSHDDDDLQMTENDTILTYGGPRPFPISMSQFPLEPTGDTAISNPPPRAKKDREARTKNRYSAKSNSIDGASLNENGEVDPSMICPYCDEPWPSAPSPTLIALLERTKRKSYADPRHGNALGLKAPLVAFIEVCQRHRFELTHLPLALERGWPTRLDFASLPDRIRAFRKELKRLLDRPDGSEFWREVRDDAKEVGMTKVVSISGQYATFERTQPGYYGEQGSVIIHQSLYTLFPPDGIPAASVLPLTPDQFLTRVLVPETAVLLIQEDMGLATREEAMEVLDESKLYGVAMFPEQVQDEEVEEVGEKLARDRAKARRKMLEERGEADEDIKREVEREQRQARREKIKSKRSLKTYRNGYGKSGESNSGTDRQTKNKKSDGSKTINIHAHQISNNNANNQTKDASEELTPRPAKVGKKFRESSALSRRSNLSPSPSPDKPMPRKTCGSPLDDPSPMAPSLSRSTENVRSAICGSKWSFQLRDDCDSPGPEDVIRGVDQHEMIAGSEYKSAMPQTYDSDSDVLVITDNETPKSRSRMRRIIGGIPRDEDSGSDASDVIEGTKRQSKSRIKIRDGNETDSSSLGQTKRRRKRKNADKSISNDEGSESHSWLLSDSSR